MKPPHKLLIGAWKSDQRRTLKTCHRYHCLKGTKKRQFARLFGRLELRYTRKYVYHKLPDFHYRSRYEVVAEDAESLVIRIHSDELKKRFDASLAAGNPEFFAPRLQQIHFRRSHGRQLYWIGLGLYCEWFLKLAPTRTDRTSS